MTHYLTNANCKLHRLSSSFYDHDHDEDDQEFFVIGDRVFVDNYRSGSVAYFGETEFASGDWVGVVLDEPTGNHDGKVQGREYFHCPPNHGLFARPHRVNRMPDSALGSSRASSHTPLPTFHSLSGEQQGSHLTRTPTASSWSPTSRSSSRSPAASSLMDSYYYDDDYRRNRVPTVASLARKLESIGEQHQDLAAATTNPHRSARPRGILKHNNSTNGHHVRSHSVESVSSEFANRNSSAGSSQGNLSGRVDDLSRRLRASSVSPAMRPPSSQFAFRPQRVKQFAADYNDPQQQQLGRRSVNLSSEPPEKGDRVLVRYSRESEGELVGTLRFMGETSFATGEWAGVELDDPVGKNDGSILGERYFYCPQNYGLFVPASRVRKQSSGDINQASSRGFDSMRSTLFSPPPKLTSTSTGGSLSRSTTPSYDLEGMSPSSNASPPAYNLSGSSYSPSTSNWTRQHSFADDFASRTPLTSSSSTRDLYKSSSQPMRPRPMLSSSSSSSTGVPKFDERDIEKELRKSLDKPATSRYTRLSSLSSTKARPKAVKYTFISNKFDGNPIACRTLIYE